MDQRGGRPGQQPYGRQQFPQRPAGSPQQPARPAPPVGPVYVAPEGAQTITVKPPIIVRELAEQLKILKEKNLLD